MSKNWCNWCESEFAWLKSVDALPSVRTYGDFDNAPIAMIVRPIQIAFLSVCMLAASCVGCSRPPFPVAYVSGKVVCDGQPIESGTVTFTPLNSSTGEPLGKSASAVVSPDGTFVLSTYGKFDGAVVGKHSVQYISSDSEAEQEATSEEEEFTPKTKPKKTVAPKCTQAQELIVEVTAKGRNEFTVELTSKPKKKR